MPRFLLSGRATAQPQNPYPIDWTNPITRGLVVALTPVNGTYRDIINRRVGTPAGTAPIPSTTPRGRSLYSPTAAGRVDFVGDEYSQHTSTGYTHFVAVHNFTSTDGGCLWTVTNDTGSDQSLYLARFGTALAVGHGNEYGPESASGLYNTLADGKTHSLCVSGPGTTARRLELDGVTILDTTGSLSPANVSSPKLRLFTNRTGDFESTGHFLLHLIWSRQLSLAESRSLNASPWQVFDSGNREIYIAATAAGGVTCTLAVTDATDTVSSAAAVTVAASLSQTDATDTLVATTTEPVTATLARTDATDTLSSAAAVAIVTTLAATDATDALASTVGMVVTATLAATDATDTLASTAVIGAAGVIVDLAVTDATDTMVSTAAVTVTAALGVTDATDTLTCATTSAIVATLALTDAQDTLGSTAAVAVVATLGVTDGADTLDSAVTTAGPVTVNLNVTDADDTLASQVVTIADTGGGGIDPYERTDGYPRGGKRSKNREPDWLKPVANEAMQALREAIADEALERAAQAAQAQEAAERARRVQELARAREQSELMLMRAQAAVMGQQAREMRLREQRAQLERIEQARADALLEDEEVLAMLLTL